MSGTWLVNLKTVYNLLFRERLEIGYMNYISF